MGRALSIRNQVLVVGCNELEGNFDGLQALSFAQIYPDVCPKLFIEVIFLQMFI